MQIARHHEQHGRRHFEQGDGKILGVLAEMRHKLRNQRQRDGDVAAEHVAHWQEHHGPVRLLAKGRIVRNHGVGRGEMFAVADQRAFRVAGGAGGVDDESGIIG